MQNPWLHLPSQPPFILPEDLPYVKIFNQSAKPEHLIHTDLLPEPFLGSLETAEVVLLNLNPGFDERDLYWHRQPDFITECRKNLSHEAEPTFYLLNSLFKESGGYEWWSKHLRECILATGHDTVANRVMNIEYFPYHSKSYTEFHSVNLPGGILPSQQYTLYLVREAIKRKKIIVIMRQEKRWLEHVPELKVYPYLKLNSSQSAYISRKNIAGGQFEKIVSVLKG